MEDFNAKVGKGRTREHIGPHRVWEKGMGGGAVEYVCGRT